jgi:L-alanine-DL-glutamate epimerase-like enolase superfamily enzyme
MRITDIEAHTIWPPYNDFNAHTLKRYHGPLIQCRTVYVVHTDTGLQGISDSWGGGPDADTVRDKYLGTDPFDWVNAEVDLYMNMALYDLMGKHVGVPAWKLMGPKLRSWIPVAAWTVSQEPAAMAEEVRQAAAKGYRWMKYHVDEVQNVIRQAEAMQEAAPPWFRVHFDFNANSDYYTMRPILAELERLPVAGRFEDVLRASDEDGWRLLREQCELPVILHHGPADFMIKGLTDGYMAGHAPIGTGLKVGAVAAMTDTPIMYQQCGGTVNQAFLAHEVAVVPTATIDHVNLCHLWKEDVTVQTMPVVGGSVQVPEGPGLGVDLDRDKLERFTAEPDDDPPPCLVRIRYGGGPTIYLRHDPSAPGQQDNMRFLERLHRFEAPGPPPAYDNDVITDFWDGDDDPAAFAALWQESESGPVWKTAAC